MFDICQCCDLEQHDMIDKILYSRADWSVKISKCNNIQIALMQVNTKNFKACCFEQILRKKMFSFNWIKSLLLSLEDLQNQGISWVI